MCPLFFQNIDQLIHKLFSFLLLPVQASVLPSGTHFQQDLSLNCMMESKRVLPRGPDAAKICSSVVAKYDFSPLVTLDFEPVL